jgi:hypothetical protein
LLADFYWAVLAFPGCCDPDSLKDSLWYDCRGCRACHVQSSGLLPS